MKQPFVKIHLKSNKRDISDRIEKFRYEDTAKEDNMVELKIKSDYAFQMADDNDIVTGAIIQFQWGYVGEVSSDVHEARITDVEVTYADRVQMIVRALDMGVAMKKATSLKIWRQKKASQIAQEIAVRYDLEALIDETDQVWDDIPQGNKSDFEFLKELSQKEADGDFVFYISGNKLHFVKRGVDKDAKWQFKYGEEGVISFAPKWRETTANSAGTSTKAVSVNPKTKKTTVTKSDDKGAVLGENLVKWDINGNKL